MKIECFYEEIMCLFGDKGNMTYLAKCLPEAEIIKTPVNGRPAFVAGDVDMLYFGSTSESGQLLAIEKLMPYRAQLAEFIDRGGIVLATGNAFEIFGEYITIGGEQHEGLNLLPIYTENRLPKRFNSLFLGKFGDTEIMGYTSRFSHSFYKEDMGRAAALFEVTKGYGMNPEDKREGIRLNNFFGTHLLGPLLIQNPDFTKELVRLLTGEERALYLEQECRAAYDVRLAELKRDIVFYD